MTHLRLVVVVVVVVLAACFAEAVHYCPVFHHENDAGEDCERYRAHPFIEKISAPSVSNHGLGSDFEPLEALFESYAAMQTNHFMADQGTWPEAIDWTAAVMETVLAGVSTSFSRIFAATDLTKYRDKWAEENLIGSFFTQLLSSYFGQDAVSLRNQAYDDVLWVVLGWLDALKFIHVHSELHYPPRDPNSVINPKLQDALKQSPWYGHFWSPAFAHRARIFWDTASRGWDDELCGGGMTWNSRLEPYKNAITNELWIAASISMYLWFPGDNNTSPWVNGRFKPGVAREPKYLAAAVEGYRWLRGINMVNDAGLFVDGYHISRSSRRGSKKCDLRDEMVYTYNQGVILTGQRGLWTATGSPSYLEDGHELIKAVIRATGWDLARDEPVDDPTKMQRGYLPPWRGLGRGGIMEERCDASGTCSQDAQTFKGVFFHHFVAFCEDIEPPRLDEEFRLDSEAFESIATAHHTACQAYSAWVSHNARAALLTRDGQGRFGSWWGAPLFAAAAGAQSSSLADGISPKDDKSTDYRNYGIPRDALWGGNDASEVWTPNGMASRSIKRQMQEDLLSSQHFLGSSMGNSPRPYLHDDADSSKEAGPSFQDWNDRGRGRTAETQNGGIALLRAWWELTASSRDTIASSRNDS